MIKIVDFNVSKQFSNRTMMTKTGVEEWSAPEMLDNKPYSEKIDLWSLGCVIYYMLTGV